MLLRNISIGAFIVIWLLPVLYCGLVNSPAPWLPAALQRRTNISRLFSSERPVWAVHAVEYCRASGREYEILNESEFFQMKPFGRRTRMQRAIGMADEKQREFLCRWLKDRLQVARGEPITSIRIVAFANTRGVEHIHGAYIQPSPADVAPDAVRIDAQHDFHDP